MAIIQMRFPGGTNKALTLSYDDGVEQDIRLMAVMQQHGLKGTFNISGGLYTEPGHVFPAGHIHRRMTLRQAQALYTKSGQEIAIHSLTHPHLPQLPQEQLMYELIKDRELLEQQYGILARGMAYPYGAFDDRVVGAVKSAGIAYARTVISTENFNIPQDFLRLPATCHHNNPRLMELAQRFVEQSPTHEPWLFYLWGHSYEFEAKDNWQMIEEFAAFIGGKDDVWYATNIDIVDYIHAYRALQSSVDGARLYNPSALTVHVLCRGKAVCVPGGETVEVQ